MPATNLQRATRSRLLSDAAVKRAKPAAEPFRLYDTQGLYLEVRPTGAKLWRVKGYIGKKEKRVALGAYPIVDLDAAREKAGAAQLAMRAGVDPLEVARAETRAALKAEEAAEEAVRYAEATTFRAVMDAWLEKRRADGRTEKTIETDRSRLTTYILPTLGSRQVGDIKPRDILTAIAKAADAGKHETADRTRGSASQVFRYAVAHGYCDRDPTTDLRGALPAPKPQRMAAITDPDRLGALLRAIDGFEGQPTTRLALQLLALTFVRPGELRLARWGEFDLKRATWRIPETRMKRRQPHDVPLSRQAIARLRELAKVTGGAPDALLFPGLRSRLRPISDATMNAALRRLGFGKEEVTGHGFRSSASTLLNESREFSVDAIEVALAHTPGDPVRAAYMRATFWDERARMYQYWADLLDSIRIPADVRDLL